MKNKSSLNSLNELKTSNVDCAVESCVSAIVAACGPNESQNHSTLRSTLVDALLKYQRKALLMSFNALVTVQAEIDSFLAIAAFV